MGFRDWQPPDVVASGQVGVRVTAALVVLVVVDLVVAGVVPGAVALAALALVAAAGIAGRRIDWRSVSGRPAGTWVPYLWTVVGLVGWATYVAAVGGRAPDRLILVLAVAVICSGVGYPLRGQMAMYAVTVASLTAGRALAGTPDLGPTLLLDAGLLLILALISATFSIYLRQARRTARWTREAAERRSELIRAVASLSRLDPQAAMEAAVDALLELGFDAAAVNELDDGVLRPRTHQGFSSVPADLSAGQGVAGRSLALLRTVVVDDYQSDADALPHRPDVGSVVAAPIIVEGAPIGAVLGARRARGPVPPLQVEILETIAAQAGRVLANARRYEAELESGRRLAELNHMKSELLASVSSELRSPLTVVRGLSETLRNRPELLDADGTLLARLNAQSERLSRMIHDLLDFSRLQAGRYDLAAVDLDLEELLREAAHPAVAFERRGSPLVTADETLLRRAARHLLASAERAFVPVHVLIDGDREDGTVAVEIELRRDRDRGGGGAIGVSLAAEILASHGAELQLTEAGPHVVFVRFVLARELTGGSVEPATAEVAP